MQYQATTPEAYINQIPEERQGPMKRLRAVIVENLPGGFTEGTSYGMIGYSVPHTYYPAGYHVNPKIPLPFISIASQKNYIALYHHGIYAYKPLNDWFVAAYNDQVKSRLDMGKSCIRFKKMKEIPYDLIGDLVSRMDMAQWIKLYEKNVKR